MVNSFIKYTLDDWLTVPDCPRDLIFYYVSAFMRLLRNEQ